MRTCADCPKVIGEKSTRCKVHATAFRNRQLTNTCAECGTPTVAVARFCRDCARKRHAAQERVAKARQRERAEATAKLEPVLVDGEWVGPRSVFPRIPDTPPPDPDVPLAAQRLEFAVAAFLRIDHSVTRLRHALRLEDPAPTAHAEAVREAVATYLRVGGTDEGLERAISTGTRAAGNTHRLPDAEEVTPEILTTEQIMAEYRSRRNMRQIA